MADTTKKRRRRGRPLKEESNAIQLEKNILDMKESFIAMVPEAHKVLRELMLDPKTNKIFVKALQSMSLTRQTECRKNMMRCLVKRKRMW